MKNVVCFGEVLWDLFPEGKKLGGAPLNVALRMKSWGLNSQIISSVGNDELGEEILMLIKQKGISTNYIQVNETFNTGTVSVTLNQNGSASYEINHPVSWDKIELNAQYEELINSSDAFIFGSLVARDPVSKKSLIKLLEFSKYNVFDVNLRPPHYSISDLELFMNLADFIKFNDEEIEEICSALGSTEESLEGQINFISNKTNTRSICVTLGEEGAILLHQGNFYKQKGYPAIVKDTVGAGDSFLGTLLSLILNGKDANEALDKACGMGALVAQNSGANPHISEADLEDFMRQ